MKYYLPPPPYCYLFTPVLKSSLNNWLLSCLITRIVEGVISYKQISIFTVIIYLRLSYIKPRAGIFSVYNYTRTYLFHSATGWGFLALYTYIFLSFNQWVGLYHYISYISPSLATGWGFLALYTYISLSFN